MAQRDYSRPIQLSGIKTPPEGVHEEIVCYTVVTGRGSAFVRHMRDERSKAFAAALVESHNALNQIRDMIEEFRGTDFSTPRERRRARADLVREIERLVARRRPL